MSSDGLTESRPARRASARPPRLAETIVRDLIEEIASGELPPGGPLPSEMVLAEQFQVSRIVLREALKTLEERGLIMVRQGTGSVVAERSRWNMLDADLLDAAIRHDPNQRLLENIVSVRANLESELTSDASTRRTPDHWQRLTPIIEQMKRSLDDPIAFGVLDRQFHGEIIGAADNEIAAAVVARLHAQALGSKTYPRNPSRDRLQASAREHEQILNLLMSKDAEGAARAMRDHILGSWSRRI